MTCVLWKKNSHNSEFTDGSTSPELHSFIPAHECLSNFYVMVVIDNLTFVIKSSFFKKTSDFISTCHKIVIFILNQWNHGQHNNDKINNYPVKSRRISPGYKIKQYSAKFNRIIVLFFNRLLTKCILQQEKTGVVQHFQDFGWILTTHVYTGYLSCTDDR